MIVTFVPPSGAPAAGVTEVIVSGIFSPVTDASILA